jgi:hypothetical protein
MTAIIGFGGALIGSLISSVLQVHLHGQRIRADEVIARRKFSFDMEMAESKFRFDRDLHAHKRRSEIAEQTLAAFFQAKEAIKWARRPQPLFVDEGKSRKPEHDETDAQRCRRNIYFIPIERLAAQKNAFEELSALQHVFVAHFGEQTAAYFEVIAEAYLEIDQAARTLIQSVCPEDNDTEAVVSALHQNELKAIGYGSDQARFEIDQRVSKVVEDIVAICRPILAAAAAAGA